MARIRTIKPEFWQDERLSQLQRDIRLLFIGLWNIADDYGRLRGHPAFIKGQVFPYDDDVDVPAWLEELEALGRIVRYERDGQSFIWIRRFSDHQKMDKRTDSKLPEPTAEEMERPAQKSAEPAQKLALEWKGKEGKGKEGKGKEQGEEVPAALGAWPIRIGRAEVLRDLWNERASPDLPRWQGLSRTRRAAVDARLRENDTWDHWATVIDRINASRFCRGDNDRGWRATPDWLVQPDSASRVLEGKYDRTGSGKTNGRARESDKDWSDWVDPTPPGSLETLTGDTPF